jgi:hypothetical protein
MRHFHGLTLALAAVTIALLAPAAHAQGADLQGRWTDPAGTYLATVGEGVPVNPPPGGGSGAWMEYHANVTNRDGSALMTEEGQLVGFTLTAQLHGNAGSGFQVEYEYAFTVDGFVVDRGVGHLDLSRNQSILDGYWKDADGSTGRLTLLRLPADADTGGG